MLFQLYSISLRLQTPSHLPRICVQDSPIKVPYYSVRQYGGLVLGAVACAGTVLTYKQEDAEMTAVKAVAWLCLALIALLLHETRPFKR